VRLPCLEDCQRLWRKHTPIEQEAEPGESTDANIYEQMWQGVDVKVQNKGKILWQDWADNTASPSHLHIRIRVPFKM
jgi:hypothetical protein